MKRLAYVAMLVILLGLGSQEGRSTSPVRFVAAQAQTQTARETPPLTPEVKLMHWSINDIRRVHAQRVAGRESAFPLAEAPMYKMRVVHQVKEGDWLLIPPNTPHWPQPNSGGLTYMVLQIGEGEPYTRSVQLTSTAYASVAQEPVFWSGDDLKKVHEVAASGRSIGTLLPLPKTPMYALYLLHLSRAE